MRILRKLFARFDESSSNENFLKVIKKIEILVSKFLSIAMILVLLVASVELGFFLITDLFTTPTISFSVTLIEIFGLFLNILIALEILENITAYLQKHIVQVELVIVTSLIAVARKIIIFDLTKNSGLELIGLAVAVLALSISYWIIHQINIEPHD